MDDSENTIVIDGQSFRLCRLITRQPGFACYQAEDDQGQICFIGRFKIAPSITAQQIEKALPLARRINNPYVQPLLAAEYQAVESGEVRLVVREAPDHAAISAEISMEGQSETRARAVLTQLTKSIAGRAAVALGHGYLSPDHVLVLDNQRICIINPLVGWLVRAAQHQGQSQGDWTAPERLLKQPADLISDCYCACAIAYALLAGEPHSRHDSTPDVRTQRVDCSPEFAALLQRGLHPDRQYRPQSPGELLQALEALPPVVSSELGDPSFTADIGDLGPEPVAAPPPSAATDSGGHRRPVQSTNRRNRTRSGPQRGRVEGEPSQRLPRQAPSNAPWIMITGLLVAGILITFIIIVMNLNSAPGPAVALTESASIQASSPDTTALPSANNTLTSASTSTATHGTTQGTKTLSGPGYLQPLDEPIRDLPQPVYQPHPEPEPVISRVHKSPIANQESVTAASNPGAASPQAQPQPTDHTVSAEDLTLISGKEIVLHARMGQPSLQNKTWTLLNHQGAFGGQAWKSIVQPYSDWKDLGNREALPNADAITYTFHAEVGVPYHYWIRGYSLAQAAEDGHKHDALFICFENPIQWSKDPALRGINPLWPGLASVDGWGQHRGWNWGSARIPSDKDTVRTDTKQSSITFTTPGPHQLSIYLDEGPMVIDTIWLSQSRGARPDSAFNPTDVAHVAASMPFANQTE